MVGKAVGRLWGHRLPAEEEKREVATAAEVAEAQRKEAVSLLRVAERTGEALRKSREQNHYGEAIELMFRGRGRS